ncbi:MAG: hypothetical protein RBT62_07165 [Spirochaetia bacterium]|nr:hypothetical protein [Spirochaetia bacterium]
MKASSLSFWILSLIIAMLAILTRSESLGLSWSASTLCGLLVNTMLVLYGSLALLFYKKL